MWKRKKWLKCVLLSLLSFTFGSIAIEGDETQSKMAQNLRLAPVVVLTGVNSRIRSASYSKSTSTRDLDLIWLRHLGKSKIEAALTRSHVLEVDFDKYMVVSLFKGSCFNAQRIHVASMVEGDTRLRLRFEVEWYQTGEARADQSFPFCFIVLPKSAKPVAIEENVQRMIGGKPIWKERAILK